MKHIYFTVTNDLSYDQRMHRICRSLSGAGYRITLVGRGVENSIPLQEENYQQKRLRCFFKKGFAFYAEYNLRLFFFLSGKKMDAICAIDLDTILPCLFISRVKGIRRVYDAHEYFTELKEVRARPQVKKFWLRVEKFSVPKFKHGYTVSDGLVDLFAAAYQRQYTVIRNLPVLKILPFVEKENFIVYQGAVNEARGFEYLIPAMKELPYKLVICGDGNFMPKLKQLIINNWVADKVVLTGMLVPDALREMACKAAIGIGLAEKEGLNQIHALPNKFLEYMHAGLPQIAMNFPEYKKINEVYSIAVLLNDLDVKEIKNTIIELLSNTALLNQMKENALRARKIFCWQAEEEKLLDFYKNLFA